jgi:deoxyribodipyrimidine photo-lyase
MKHAVFIFHRDLRIVDNTTLIQTMREGFQIIPIFVFPSEQIDPKKNAVFSNAAVQFMCESLLDLDTQLQKYGSTLHIFKGDYTEVLTKLKGSHDLNIQRVCSNRDESVYAHQRDQKIHAWCEHNHIEFYQHEDYGLVGLCEGLLPDGRPYTVLQQYYNRFDKDIHVRKPSKMRFQASHFVQGHISTVVVGMITTGQIKSFYTHNPNIKVQGGRQNGLKNLRNLRRHRDYGTSREFPGKEGTTRASGYLKFGCFSIREMYWEVVKQFGKHHGIIRELVFRDFYYKIYALKPELQRTEAFHATLDQRIPWKYDKTRWDAWTEGRTGIPLVDAGMRQLATEGWMHNRVRMVVATVATRYLLIDWRLCAKFFYSSLVDADPFSNTAGWQWSAGVGVQNMIARLRPPMNPFLQSKTYDAQCEYIKHWVPELQDVEPRDIHRWFEKTVQAKYANTHVNYPAPIVDPKAASIATTELFQSILRR